MVHEIQGSAEFATFSRQPGKLAVVDFSASWCGPCRKVAPEYDALARKYPDVAFAKVMEDTNKDLIAELSVQAFPTFRFYVEGRQVDEVRGANIAGVEEAVIRHKASVRPHFEGAGFSLGGGGAAPSEADARAARLARFGASAAPRGTPPPPSAAVNASLNAKILAADTGDDDDPRFAVKPPAAPAAAAAAAVPAAAAAAGDGAAPAPMDVDAAADAAGAAPAAAAGGDGPQALRAVDADLLKQLTEEMGFPEGRAKRALALAPQPGLEASITWLMEHQDDPNVDEPVPEYSAVAAAAAADAAANSLKCDDCGTLLRDMVAAELHAHKTGHSNFSESKEEVIPLTPEQKAAKVAALKDRLAARRLAREAEEKADDVNREKARRTMGKEMRATREEMEAQSRMREAQLRKKEKLDAQRERERLRAEIAKDKAERKVRGGKLASTLGVEGYQPTGLQQDDTPAGAAAPAPGASLGASQQPAVAAAAAERMPREERLVLANKAVELLSQQRVGGQGGTAMKTILLYMKNVIAHPQEDKYRAISLDNKAFKSRVGGCLGGVSLLRAIGFNKTGEGADARLVMSAEDCDASLLTEVQAKLEAAVAAYQPLT